MGRYERNHLTLLAENDVGFRNLVELSSEGFLEGYHRGKANIDMGMLERHAEGVIVLTDMFGGTPSNLAISIMEQARIEVLAGVNLPMLVKLASVRNRPIAEAVRMAQEAGRKYITVASRILAKEAS